MKLIPQEYTTDWRLLQLEYQGYTIVPDAIPPELLTRLRKRFDELITTYENVPTSLLHPQTDAIDLNRLFELDPVFEELMDLPAVFPIAEQVFAGDIELLGSAIGNYTPPGAGSRGGWHHDGNAYIRFTFFLSDLSEAEGPTAVLPGSHHLNRLPPSWANEENGDPRELPGMLPVTGAAGTCLINNTLIWHTGTPNTSKEPRRIIWVVYKHTSWETAPQEHLRYTPEFAERQTSPTRRKLCGLST